VWNGVAVKRGVWSGRSAAVAAPPAAAAAAAKTAVWSTWGAAAAETAVWSAEGAAAVADECGVAVWGWANAAVWMAEAEPNGAWYVVEAPLLVLHLVCGGAVLLGGLGNGKADVVSKMIQGKIELVSAAAAAAAAAAVVVVEVILVLQLLVEFYCAVESACCGCWNLAKAAACACYVFCFHCDDAAGR